MYGKKYCVRAIKNKAFRGPSNMYYIKRYILKDVIVRTQQMAGKDSIYVPGWDCHGLPIEWKIEEQ